MTETRADAPVRTLDEALEPIRDILIGVVAFAYAENQLRGAWPAYDDAFAETIIRLAVLNRDET